MRKVVPKDLYGFKFVHDPTISSDGRYILFTVTQAKGPKEYTSSIWKYFDGQCNPLDSGTTRDFNPVFSPNGNRFLYLSSVAVGSQELWVSDLRGADKQQVLRLDGRKISSPRWSPDEKSIFFLSDYDPLQSGTPKTDVRLITRMNYRFDGEGYLHDRRTHVFAVNLEEKKIRQITKGEFDVAALT